MRHSPCDEEIQGVDSRLVDRQRRTLLNRPQDDTRGTSQLPDITVLVVIFTRACERSMKRSAASRKPGGAKRRGEPTWQKRMEQERSAEREKIIEIRLSAECFFCRSHYAHMLCTGVVWCCTCSLGRASKPAMSYDRNTFNGDQ